MSFRESIVLEWSSCLNAQQVMFVDRHNRAYRTATLLRRVCGSVKCSCHGKASREMSCFLLSGEVIDF